MRKMIDNQQNKHHKAVISKKRAARATRKKPAPKWVEPTIKTIAIFSVVATIFVGPFWVSQSDIISRGVDSIWKETVSKTAQLGLRVDQVLLRGRRNASRSNIIQTVGLNRGDPILSFQINALRKRLIKLPWIRDATIKRKWPDIVEIHIAERQPMVLWQKKKRLYLMDTEGVAITSKGLDRFRNLLIVVGEGAPKATPTLLAMIASQPSLVSKVAAATLVGKRRWNVILKGGIKIRLPEKDPHKAWQHLAHLNTKHKLLARDVNMIDMRLPRRLLIRPGVLGAQTTSDRGQKT
jgi:cell division protein FtsQ